MAAAPRLVAALAVAVAVAIVQQDPPPVCYDAPPAASHPENDERRVALLLRGESFRGLHMGLTSDLKRDVVCLPASYDVQKACAENIVEHVIEALEKQGVAVDVFVSTYGCVGAADLVERGAFGLVPGNGDKETQQATIVAAFDKLERHVADSGSTIENMYRSVLMWRFDVITTVAWASDASAGHLTVDRDKFYEVDMDHMWRRALEDIGGTYATYKDMACAEETKAELIPRPGFERKRKLGEDDDAAEKKKRRRDPFDRHERRPDDHGACPRPHVYRTTDGRGAPYCDFLHKRHGGPRCDGEPHRGEMRDALRGGDHPDLKDREVRRHLQMEL
ncbi:GTP binding protein [Aureococcus anophagefferens]|nr:GTP binding protein [Aureococcus anophagefferens]